MSTSSRSTGSLSTRALYESCGFVTEGVLHGEFFLDGQDVDDHLMALALDELDE